MTTEAKESRIIVALDGMSRNESLDLAEELRGLVWGFKVNDLLIESGVQVVQELAKIGPVFADPKLHDIPNTVANSTRRLATSGASMITVHASAGEAALKKAVASAGSAVVLAITVLTSLSDKDSKYIYQRKIDDVVVDFARLALDCGVHGVVCSPQELRLLAEFPEFNSLLKVTPGVRPQWFQNSGDDQSRTMTPGEAIHLGASHLVIGRPITAADNRLAAVNRLNEECFDTAS